MRYRWTWEQTLYVGRQVTSRPSRGDHDGRPDSVGLTALACDISLTERPLRCKWLIRVEVGDVLLVAIKNRGIERFFGVEPKRDILRPSRVWDIRVDIREKAVLVRLDLPERLGINQTNRRLLDRF